VLLEAEPTTVIHPAPTPLSDFTLPTLLHCGGLARVCNGRTCYVEKVVVTGQFLPAGGVGVLKRVEADIALIEDSSRGRLCIYNTPGLLEFGIGDTLRIRVAYPTRVDLVCVLRVGI